jgi:hypothetical protein
MAKNQKLIGTAKNKAIPRRLKSPGNYTEEVPTPANNATNDGATTLVEQELDKLASLVYSYRLITQQLASLHGRLTGTGGDNSLSFPAVDVDKNNVLQTLRNINDAYENNIDVASKILNEITTII